MSNAPNLWCGIDISKKSFDASLVTHQHVRSLQSIPVQQFQCSPEGVSAFLIWLQAHCDQYQTQLSQAHLVLESTGKYSTDFYAEICGQQEGLRISIVNPAHASHFQKSLGIRSKTDALDARALGLFARERRPEPYIPSSLQQRQLQELFRQRTYYIGQRVAQEARLKEASMEVVRQIEKQAVEMTKKIIDKIAAKIKDLLNTECEIGRDVALLMSIPGVGMLTAAGVIAELGDLRQFAKAAELSSFAGLAPQIRESGTSVRGRPRLSKAGNSVVRKALYMASLTWTQKPTEGLGVVYARLVLAGKAKKSALLAVTRKLLVLMRAVLISGEEYDPEFKKTRSKKKTVENVMKKSGRMRLEPKF